MTNVLYIDTLTDAEIARVEARLRPRMSSFSGFLGQNESLKVVIHGDAETLKNLGITHEQIADKLEYLVQNPQGDGKFKVNSLSTRGMQEDPFQEKWTPGTYSNLDVTITNQDGESIRFGGPIIGLIRNYQFFEGKEVSYRLDPTKAVRVLQIKPGETSIPQKTEATQQPHKPVVYRGR